MKRTKKLLALVLAMVMAFSLMAVTAAAVGVEEHEHVCSTETIQPRMPAPKCPECFGSMSAGSTERLENGHYSTTYTCNTKNCDGTLTVEWWA